VAIWWQSSANCDRMRKGSMGAPDRDPGGGPESRFWAAVVERGQEPKRLDQTKNTRPDGE
jgi:hypothetical protein